jgi:putative transposase
VDRDTVGNLPSVLEVEAPGKQKENKDRWRHQLIDRLKGLVESHPTYGYRKIWALCKRSGLDLSPSKVHRLLKGEGLLLPRPQEKRAKRSQVTFDKPDGPNQLWQLDITYLWIELYGFH